MGIAFEAFAFPFGPSLVGKMAHVKVVCWKVVPEKMGNLSKSNTEDIKTSSVIHSTHSPILFNLLI